MTMTTYIKYISILIVLLLSLPSLANILTVKQDGTSDYTIIQDAVNAAVDGDTVLVWPGTYTENVDIVGKNITLGSLFLTTGDEAYIDSTIIDGNQTGSCVVFRADVGDGILTGFTLQHGSGYMVYDNYPAGGGVAIHESIAKITNCIVKDNTAYEGGGGIAIWRADTQIINCTIKNNFSNKYGGGIHCIMYSTGFISGSNIINNHAYRSGGGIAIAQDCSIDFDTVNLSNIYLNFAMLGNDIHKASFDMPMNVTVDTFTVLNPDTYFISSIDNFGHQIYDITFSATNSKIATTDADLYVNPVTGDNNNTGLTPGNPLKSIAFAYSSIVVDSLERNTIHLADGVYSDSANNEKFPLNIRPYICVKGQSMEGTILDGRYKSMLIKGNNGISNYSFSNMTLKKGTAVDYNNPFNNTHLYGSLYWANENVSLDSMMFTNSIGEYRNAGLSIIRSNNTNIKNCIFQNTVGLEVLDISMSDSGDTCRISNCSFISNKPDYNNPDKIYGKAIRISGSKDSWSNGVVMNSLFENNDKAALLSYTSNSYLINNTFVNNSLEVPGETVALWFMNGNHYMYNCISYNNGEYPIWLNPWEGQEVNLHINNSLIEGGEESVTLSGDVQLYYAETNIDADPVFLGQWEHPYQINDGSPCIDAGTLDFPDWIELPDTDLAGNPRIVGTTIDMGCYEWNPTVGVHEYKPINKELEKLLKAAPNPFNHSTTITAVNKTKSNVKLEIYNNYGQRVNVLFDGNTLPSTSQIIWYGDNNQRQILPTGIYYVVMFINDKEVESIKLIRK